MCLTALMTALLCIAAPITAPVGPVPLSMATLAVFLAGALLGMRGVELASLLIIFGAPTAVNSAVMAQQMGSDADLATEAVVFTTAFSALTVFLFVFVLKSLALI